LLELKKSSAIEIINQGSKIINGRPFFMKMGFLERPVREEYPMKSKEYNNKPRSDYPSHQRNPNKKFS